MATPGWRFDQQSNNAAYANQMEQQRQRMAAIEGVSRPPSSFLPPGAPPPFAGLPGGQGTPAPVNAPLAVNQLYPAQPIAQTPPPPRGQAPGSLRPGGSPGWGGQPQPRQSYYGAQGGWGQPGTRLQGGGSQPQGQWGTPRRRSPLGDQWGANRQNFGRSMSTSTNPGADFQE